MSKYHPPKETLDEDTLTTPLTEEGMDIIIEENTIMTPKYNRARNRRKSNTAIIEDVQSAVTIITGTIADAIYVDPHQWSRRPCATCRVVSALVGKPFGCDRYRLESMPRRKTDNG